jgi:hypothetical protein
LKLRLVAAMDQHLRVRESLRYLRMIGDVIEVAVRQPQTDDVPSISGATV